MTGNLLLEPLISVRGPDGEVRRLSLPGVLAALQADQVADYPALQPHQTHPWHAFLVQLAVMALEGEELPPQQPGRANLPQPGDEEAWRRRLRALTPEFPGDEPWTMVVQDLSKPAFFQPPVPENDWRVLKRTEAYPDDLDVLIAARNHGLKSGRVKAPTPEDWLYALLGLQTFGGFLGQGNYGVARMNGGFATRPGVQLVSRPNSGGQWARDCRVLLDYSGCCQAKELPFDPAGHRLLWLLPWDGAASLAIESLHPLYLEVCRRIRLQMEEETIRAYMVGTKVARVAAKDLKGNMADPWIPILTPDGAAYNRRPGYRAVQEVLFPDPAGKQRYRPALLQGRHPPDDGHHLSVRFRVLVRGQGKTEGYVERTIPIPREAEVFAWGSRVPEAARVAQAMVELASAAEYKVLKPALLRFMQAARDTIEYKQPETNAWADRWASELDRRIDAAFFPALWRCLTLLEETRDENASADPWRETLRQLTAETFEQAVASLPLPNALRHKARALAEGMSQNALRKHLSPVLATEGV